MSLLCRRGLGFTVDGAPRAHTRWTWGCLGHSNHYSLGLAAGKWTQTTRTHGHFPSGGFSEDREAARCSRWGTGSLPHNSVPCSNATLSVEMDVNVQGEVTAPPSGHTATRMESPGLAIFHLPSHGLPLSFRIQREDEAALACLS